MTYGVAEYSWALYALCLYYLMLKHRMLCMIKISVHWIKLKFYITYDIELNANILAL